MPIESYDVRKQFERGVVILSLDTEQIWGYLDLLNETQFQNKYPDAHAAHGKVLAVPLECRRECHLVHGGRYGAPRKRWSTGPPNGRIACRMGGKNSRRRRSVGSALVSAVLRGAPAQSSPFPGDRASWGADSFHMDRCARDTGGGKWELAEGV